MFRLILVCNLSARAPLSHLGKDLILDLRPANSSCSARGCALLPGGCSSTPQAKHWAPGSQLEGNLSGLRDTSLFEGCFPI